MRGGILKLSNSTLRKVVIQTEELYLKREATKSIIKLFTAPKIRYILINS